MRERTLLRLLAAPALAGAFAAAPSRADGVPPGPGTYVFDVVIAPVCLEGSHSLAIQSAAGRVAGPLAVTTDVKGRVTGTLSLSGQTFTVTGSVSLRRGVERVSLTARVGSEKITLEGTLEGTTFTGTTKGTGTVAAGRGSFTLDVSSAPPQTATLVATLAAARNGRMTGTGTATVCGVPLALGASSSATKRKFSLKLSTKGFRFTGEAAPGEALDWKVKGFGATTLGADLPVTALPAPSGLAYAIASALYEDGDPIPVNTPTSAMPRFTTFSVAPPLPTGFTLDAATGAISGSSFVITPSAPYVVTATNPAGSAQTTLTLGVRINRARSFAPQPEPLSDADVRHFLRRTQFGVRQSEVNAIAVQGLETYVDAMLVFPQNTQAETDAFQQLVRVTNPPDPQAQAGNKPSTTQLARWWTHLMVNTQAPFQETLALFWHDHFGVSSAEFDDSRSRFIAQHVNLLRRQGNGNLRTLLVDVARDPAMLIFLNGVTSTRQRPNENFAREFWELFTLGVDNGYTQLDIQEASRAWTGYRERFDAATGLTNVELDLTRHDAGAKTFLGTTILGQNGTDDYAAVVDATLVSRKVAEYVVTKLFEYFCHESPSQSLVDTMAAQLRASNYELAPLLKAMFRSEAFFSARSQRSLVKSPVEFTVGFLRSTGLKTMSSSGTPRTFDVAAVDNSLNNQSQRPTQPPTVAGWPTGELWLSAQSMVERINVVRSFVDDTTDQTAAGINVASLLPPVAERSAGAVVDALAKLLDVQLDAADRTDLVDYLNTVRDAQGNVTSSPFDGSSQQHLDERVRGLLYILAQHPTYQSR